MDEPCSWEDWRGEVYWIPNVMDSPCQREGAWCLGEGTACGQSPLEEAALTLRRDEWEVANQGGWVGEVLQGSPTERRGDPETFEGPEEGWVRRVWRMVPSGPTQCCVMPDSRRPCKTQWRSDFFLWAGRSLQSEGYFLSGDEARWSCIPCNG